jgi:hypothetical protein
MAKDVEQNVGLPSATTVDQTSQYQKSLFPFSAFSQDDPNTTENPNLTLSDAWAMVLKSLTVDGIATEGAGIIGSGGDSDASYVKYFDGTLRCRGWGYVTWTSGATSKTKSITIPLACIDATYDVSVTMIGAKDTNPTARTDTDAASTNASGSALIVSATSFTVVVSAPTGPTDTKRRMFSWMLTGRWK